MLYFINCREPQCDKLYSKYIEEIPILQHAFGWPLNEPHIQTRVKYERGHNLLWLAVQLLVIWLLHWKDAV